MLACDIYCMKRVQRRQLYSVNISVLPPPFIVFSFHRFVSPGYHTLFAVFAVRCLPHQTFLQYIDHGFLQLTETFVSRLMTGLCINKHF